MSKTATCKSYLVVQFGSQHKLQFVVVQRNACFKISGQEDLPEVIPINCAIMARTGNQTDSKAFEAVCRSKPFLKKADAQSEKEALCATHKRVAEQVELERVNLNEEVTRRVQKEMEQRARAEKVRKEEAKRARQSEKLLASEKVLSLESRCKANLAAKRAATLASEAPSAKRFISTTSSTRSAISSSSASSATSSSARNYNKSAPSEAATILVNLPDSCQGCNAKSDTIHSLKESVEQLRTRNKVLEKTILNMSVLTTEPATALLAITKLLSNADNAPIPTMNSTCNEEEEVALHDSYPSVLVTKRQKASLRMYVGQPGKLVRHLMGLLFTDLELCNSSVSGQGKVGNHKLSNEKITIVRETVFDLVPHVRIEVINRFIAQAVCDKRRTKKQPTAGKAHENIEDGTPEDEVHPIIEADI